MPRPSLTTDQLEAFVELARTGSLRSAAAGLHITEQGVRNRLVSLERQMGVELYRKQRGPRRAGPLTNEGQRFLPHAMALLNRLDDLGEIFSNEPRHRDVHVLASQYLIAYLLIRAVVRFHRKHPHIRVRLSARTEREIEDGVLHDPDVELGVAAPYEPSPQLTYQHLFSMNWSLIGPQDHPLLRKRRIQLEHLADAPLILYERGSTGRQHVVEAFQRRGLTPRVEMEATTTDIIVRMVESGLGLSLVPLMPGGAVTRGHNVSVRRLGDQIRPIHSGVLQRRGESLSEAADCFLTFISRHSPASSTIASTDKAGPKRLRD